MKLNRFKIFGLLLALTAVAGTGLSTRPAQAAGLLIADGGFGGVLTLEEHDAKVTINNGIAVTEVTQVFRNTEQRIVEALYTFPVPKGASVSNFSMWINGKEVIGEVVEKKRAREIYESYKTTRRDPGLLEQVDYKTFEMRIFPIPAGAEQRVQVTYCQELDVDHDAATYVYPLATVTKNGIDQKVQGKFAVTVDVKNEVPIVELASPSHNEEVVVANYDEHYRRASLEVNGGDLSRDFVLNFKMKRPRTGVDIVTSKKPGEDGYFQLTLTAGEELGKAAEGMDYVFILDISGSMANDRKLATSRNTVGSFVEQLGAEDRFEVMPFNVTPTPLFKELRPSNETNHKAAAAFLETQRARGGTVLRPAIQAAYQYRTADRPLNVVILSDGMTEQSEQRELVQLIGQRPTNCRVFCIGIGNEVNRPLLTQLAEDAGGLAAFVSQADDFDSQAKAFRRKLLHPVGTNLSIKFAGGDVYDIEPQKLGNLFYGAPLRMYGRYKQSGNVALTIEGEIQGAPLSKSVTIDFPDVNNANPEIERMWASHRVDGLLRNMQRTGDSQTTINQVVGLCEEHSIVSEYASFIVLENDAEYQRWKIDRRNANRVGRDRAAQADLQTRLESLRNASMAKLAPQQEKAPTTGNAVPVQIVPQVLPEAAPQTSAPNDVTPQRGFDVVSNGGGGGGNGGGALDPVTALLVLGTGCAGALAAKRRRK
ncbi:MAG: VIT and VWA domain-containing protein [Planctomycetota bacterium]|nr:VIT and VWA domain-containing protein [Planctomycetota bacterium]